MNGLTVYFDASCGFCVRCAAWLRREPAYFPVTLVASRDERGEPRRPELFRDGEDELLAVSDAGEVYRGFDALVICLYALKKHRRWSYRFAKPALKPLVKRAYTLFSSNRAHVSSMLRLSDKDDEVADSLRTWTAFQHLARPPEACSDGCAAGSERAQR